MDLQKIKTLLDFVGRSRVSELTVSEAGTTVIVRNLPVPFQPTPPVTPRESAQIAPAAPKEQPDRSHVHAPLSGVVHQSNSPGAAPLVAMGDVIEAGQALCIVEAMKVFTTVPAPFGGVVKRIFFDDGQEVSLGDPLVEIG